LKTLYIIRVICLFLAVAGVIGMGVEVFINDAENVVLVYVFGVMLFVGLTTANSITFYISVKNGADESADDESCDRDAD